MEKYYRCEEWENVWSYRENTEEQLVLILIDEQEKCFTLENENYVDNELQQKLASELKNKGYRLTLSKNLFI